MPGQIRHPFAALVLAILAGSSPVRANDSLQSCQSAGCNFSEAALSQSKVRICASRSIASMFATSSPILPTNRSH